MEIQTRDTVQELLFPRFRAFQQSRGDGVLFFVADREKNSGGFQPFRGRFGCAGKRDFGLALRIIEDLQIGQGAMFADAAAEGLGNGFLGRPAAGIIGKTSAAFRLFFCGQEMVEKERSVFFQDLLDTGAFRDVVTESEYHISPSAGRD